MDFVSPQDTEIRALIRKSQAQASIDRSDVVDGEHLVLSEYEQPDRLIWCLDKDDDDEGSGSGSDDE